MNAEQLRLEDYNWKSWGPYLTDRQWGTVREDYSADGQAWNSITHDMARSKAYRWGEEGIAGISDKEQLVCFALALWNGKDPILKERYFGLTGPEGNHGEDVKELYYYLDSTPTHSYMKMLYKYPQQEYPYRWLVEENRKRSRFEPEFELADTGIFNEGRYFDVFVEYAKAGDADILIKITAYNRGPEDAPLHVIPTVWLRNTWSWGYDDYKPQLASANNGHILIQHKRAGDYSLYAEEDTEALFCNNETNLQKLYAVANTEAFTKDGINDYIVLGNRNAVNKNAYGTKAAFNYAVNIQAGGSKCIRLRLSKGASGNPFSDFEEVFAARINEADEFYGGIQQQIESDDEKSVQRQAFAGMLWNKQFYYYDVQQWLDGDPEQPAPPPQRMKGKNRDWRHLNNADIISMPDKWEYPWYAAWDLAFHCLPFAVIDARFAKQQLQLLTKEWYMHPNGQLPAYEWEFSDVNPPVHAWATWRVYKIDQKNNNGKSDIAFLESVFHKLLLNFTWWVNRKDAQGNNIFQGGFLGLDNIGVFDRNTVLTSGGYMEQADGTSWMAMYSLNLMRISLELARHNKVYEDMATKFFEHFLYIADAMASMGSKNSGLWDEEDEFFYDVLKCSPTTGTKLKVRSMVGLIPLFAVEVIEHEFLQKVPEFAQRLNWFLEHRPQLASLVSRWYEKGIAEKHLLSLLRGHRIKKILRRMLDENEFLSEYGVRSLSRYHEQHPYAIDIDGNHFSVNYTPGESTTGLFGGNSNWRGPVWLPVNFLIVESLQRFHHYYGNDFKVECPTGSGNYLTLRQVADFISKRLTNIFLKDKNGRRAVFNNYELMQQDPHFKDYILFYEYFHADTGHGMGAAHQTGWTGLIAKLIEPARND
ncbi:MGH1-like glycoside hydrolase domain-containing protein [Foetidibacter luteolus]|uniref:MGH1-like glycoside hydrolase domain-containing protein n=1 Tax=Foetidibacter luteolus TaxID=2608880 RepID=UPI00129A40DD|nr:glucosidase [Foetidibacter luteolus]